MQTHLMHHLKSRDGSSTFRIETLGDHLLEEEEEDPHRALQDYPPEGAEGAEVVEVAEEEGEHSHYPDTHLPNQPKSF